MRIISGRLKGFVFKVPDFIRPTEQKVSKSLFDILTPCITGASFLDLYSGSGNIGFEAFSRGAEIVVMVEESFTGFRVIEENISSILRKFSFAKPGNFKAVKQDAGAAIEAFSKRSEKFDIIFLDPPYYKELVKKSLQTIIQYDILAPNGLVIAQAHRKDAIGEMLNLKLYRKENYSDTALYFFKNSS